MSTNRSYYFMLGTVGLAGLIAIVMFLLSGRTAPAPLTPQPGETMTMGEESEKIEAGIKALSAADFSPEKYTILITEINAAKNDNSSRRISAENAAYLTTILNTKYGTLVKQKINGMMAADPVNEKDLNYYLNHANSIGLLKAEAAQIKSQLSAVKYYRNVLPGKVDAFVSRSAADYNTDIYNALKAEVTSMVGLDVTQRSKSAVQNEKNTMLNKLLNFNKEYIDYQENVGSIFNYN